MIHIRKFEIPYFLAFFLYGFSIIVNTDSYISTFFSMYMNAIIKYTAMALLFVSLRYRRWPLKRLVGWTAVGILAVVISFVVDKPTLVLSAAILICANEVDFERIKKCTIIFNVIYIVIKDNYLKNLSTYNQTCLKKFKQLLEKEVCCA